MRRHIDLGQKEIIQLIRAEAIAFAGNSNLKIYGKINCGSGKRMKKEKRVFFESETEAISHGFRPCGHCMRDRYSIWRKSI
jgi:methylphosphotriester-DNA--protein-cysteine methyltransferase